MKMKILIVSFVLLFILNCAVSPKKFDSLKVGMTSADAEKILGQPNTRYDENERPLQDESKLPSNFIYSYPIQVGTAFGDTGTYYDVIFNDGKVTEWGESTKLRAERRERKIAGSCDPVQNKYRQLLLGKTVWFNKNARDRINPNPAPNNFAKLKITDVQLKECLDADFHYNLELALSDGKTSWTLEPNIAAFSEKEIKGSSLLAGCNIDSNCIGSLLPFDPKKKFSFSEKTWDAIEKHTFFVGMPSEALRLAFGLPDKINRTVLSSGTNEQWIYRRGKTYFVYVEGGKITSFQD